jgi:renalase
LMIQATPQWSLSHVDADIPQMQDILLKRSLDLLQLSDFKIDFMTTHRWRYARTTRCVEYPQLWDNDFKIGVCGDWCQSNNGDKNPQGVESAYLSAVALSDFLLG